MDICESVKFVVKFCYLWVCEICCQILTFVKFVFKFWHLWVCEICCQILLFVSLWNFLQHFWNLWVWRRILKSLGCWYFFQCIFYTIMCVPWSIFNDTWSFIGLSAPLSNLGDADYVCYISYNRVPHFQASKKSSLHASHFQKLYTYRHSI